MKTIGFPISPKENENRRAIVPRDILKLTHPESVWVESGFGDVLGISDDEYRAAGCRVAAKEETLRADIICDPKIGDANYLSDLQKGQIIFGWVHATQNRDITDAIINSGLTAYGWEKMFENGRHVFWFNNELAGEAAVLNAFQCYGELPFGLNVAVIGNGNTARGAVRVLNMLGARVMQYNRRMEALLREEIGNYDVIVNCILWDVKRNDHVIYRDDLKRMKKNAMIIDVSCDRHGGIETCIPTTIEKPTYIVDGILHYAVDHTPSFFYKTFSYQNSEVITPYVEQLMSGNLGKTLNDCLLIRDGVIVDQEIIDFQKR
jgi:N5-(carboxyethyl)ornithine synthase